MSKSVKELHMATNLTDLNERAGLDKNKFNTGNKPVDRLINGMLKTYESAKTCMSCVEEDEEYTYMMLFRTMELWIVLTKSQEYKTDKKYYESMYKQDITNCFRFLEQYSRKLEERYDKENLKGLAQFQLESSITLKKKKGAEEKSKDSVKSAVNNSLGTSEENGNELGKFDSQIIPQPPEPIENLDYYGGKKFIECQELREMIMENGHSVLIIDIRPKKDFALSQIVKSRNINIPATSIIAGLSANRLGVLVESAEEKAHWGCRDQFRQVVMMDWHSETKDVIPNSPLSNLQNILLKWDPDTVYKDPPLILNGGYERWLDMFPSLTNNSKITRPQKQTNNPFIHLSDHLIEYPLNELDEIINPKPKTPKPTAIEKAKTNVPPIDRTTKPDSTPSLSMEVTEEPSATTPATQSNNTITTTSEHAMEEEQDLSDKTKRTSIKDSSAKSNDVSLPVRPETPPRLTERSYPSTPKQRPESGDSDVTTEMINYSPTTPRSSLKRASSSPNINKLVDDDSEDLFSRVTPSFDRSTKPKPMYNFDSPRGGNTDSIYLANGKEGRGLTGLKNLGNLCYMNSIMQCISNTVDLTEELTRFQVTEINTRRQIASEVRSLLRVLWQGETRVSTCRSLKARVGALRQSFSTSEQQDSHEFLTLLMDWLHEDLNEPSSITSLSGADESTGEKAWGEFKRKNNSLILDLFYGQLKSTVTCCHCQKQSVLFEPFSNLSVPLPPNQESMFEKDRKYTLQECLKLYLAGEMISGWICPSCKTPREATKKLDITRLPPVLIIHLKRFMTDMVGVGWCRKRMNMVEFPINDFSMRPYTHKDSELRFHSYNLYAVSNHYGSMESGHYTAYCKNHVLNKWYKFDDQDVNEISPADVRSSAAYILFYESTR